MSLDEPLRLEGFGGGVTEEGFLVEDDDDESTGTFADLVTDADPEEFDRNYRLTSSEEAFGTGEAPAIPRPWFGIPRTAIVYNLNYVYDDANDEWVRDTGNSGGGGAVTVLDSGTADIINASTGTIETGIGNPERDIRASLGFGDKSQLTNNEFAVVEDLGTPGTNETGFWLAWDEGGTSTGTEQWLINVKNRTSISPLTYRWLVFEVS